jgi:transposase
MIFALISMHEIPKGHASVDYREGLAAKGREYSWRVERHQNRGPSVASERLEVDSHQPTLRDKPASRYRLDPQSQQAWTRQCSRRTTFRSSNSRELCCTTETGRCVDEVAGGIRAAAHAMGRCCRGRVPAQGMQCRAQATTSAQLAQATRLRSQAADIRVYTGHRRRSCRLPARAQKKLHRILKLGELALLVFSDESGFSLHPKLGRVWARRGTQPVVPTTSQHHKRLNLFGWVEPLYGWHGLFRWPKGNRQGFLAFLKYLCHRVKGWKIYLYVDGAPWHKGSEVRHFLSQHPEIKMDYLPPYHPELNVQEHVWRHIRYTVTTNRYHPTVDLIEQAIRRAQRRWKPDKIRHLCKVI